MSLSQLAQLQPNRMFTSKPNPNPGSIMSVSSFTPLRRLCPRLVALFTFSIISITSAFGGAFYIDAWFDDSTIGIVSEQTLWAHHFGNNQTATINGVTVPGSNTGNPSVPGQFEIVGMPSVLGSQSNNLTALGGSGSAVFASGFIYGESASQITLEGLTAGQTYTVSFYGVGIDAPAERISEFGSGVDSIPVDENSPDTGNGLRVDFLFTATAMTQVITITPADTNGFYLCGIALRQPFLVTTNSDDGFGSLRRALLDADTLTGSATISLASSLSGQTITLASELSIARNVTIDATVLPGGLTLSGGGVTRIFSVGAGSTNTLTGLAITGGNGTGSSGYGGAIRNAGTLILNRCALTENSTYAGGAIYNPDGTLTMTNCTLAGNSAATYGGAIINDGGTLTLTHCTLAFNHANGTNENADGGGAIDNYNEGTINLTACILAGNTIATENGPELWMETGTVTATHCFLRDGTSSTITNGINGNLVGTTASPLNAQLAALANYGGTTQTLPPQPGSPAINAASAIPGLTFDQRGYPRSIGLAPDIGAVEGIFNPAGPGRLTGVTRLGSGAIQFGFTNYSGMPYFVLASTNATLPVNAWLNLGSATETAPGSGHFQFTDPQATNFPQRFYRVRTP
jgi:hypothetical protein